MIDTYRRHLLLTAAGTATAGLALPIAATPARPSSAAAASTNGWTYVAPGESIQAAIEAGAKAIQLGSGTYAIRQPIIPDNGCTIRGVGQSTRLLATANLPAMIAVGAGLPVDGVNLSDFVLDCDGKAQVGVHFNIVGTTGNYQGEPDAVCRVDNLLIYDAALDGMVYAGTDTQGCVTTRVRVRRAQRHGFNVLGPDNWFTDCEATTSSNAGAGFYIGTANCFFTACKAWYCRGYGFHIKGTRNKLLGCEAQDIANHGFFVEYGNNLLNSCVADTCSYKDVGGTSNVADGFYVKYDAALSLVGCQSFDRRPGGGAAQQRYGFNVPKAMVNEGRLVAPTGWNNVSGLVFAR